MDRFYEAQMREVFMRVAWSNINRPYTWGGDDPSGFDCSGLVVECSKAVGLMGRQQDATADMIYQRYRDAFGPPNPNSTFIDEGWLCFWKSSVSDKMVHIEIAINPYLSIGAAGGGSNVKTPEDAWKYNAYIKVRPIRGRGNFAGAYDAMRLLWVHNE